jgi:hypothetical protein
MEQGMITNSSGVGLADITQAQGRLSFFANNQKIPWMLCPSSPLPQTELLRNGKQPTCVTPSYVGISGATNHMSNRLTTELPFLETRLKPKQGIAASNAANVSGSPTTPQGSQQSWGGMLTPNECYGMAAAIDGTSNTMVVSEQSDYFYSNHQQNKTGFRIRIDGSYTNAGSGTPTGGWWWLGTNNGYTSSQGLATQVKSYNITTLRSYSGGGSPGAPANSMIGFSGKNAMLNVGNAANSTTVVQGIGQQQQNNPLLAAHPNTVLAVFMDGHVQALTRNTPAPIVKRLATRDDGQQIANFD